MPNKFYSFPKSVFEYYHGKIKDWVSGVLPTKTSDLTNDSDFLDQLALTGIIASTFSESSTYAVDDYVLYNHTLYRCKTAISTAGVWDSSKWDATKTQDLFQGSAPGLVPAPASDSRTNNAFLSGTGAWNKMVPVTNAEIDEIFAEGVIIGGRNYPYVQIGNQLWLAENLDYKFLVNGSQIPIGESGNPSTPAAWYYNNDGATYGVNGNKYGLLYNWYAVSYIETNKSTLLPEGWHVPTTTEWDALVTAVGGSEIAGTKLKSTTGWSSDSGSGTDDYGFTALPAGRRGSGSFVNVDSSANFWTANEQSSSNAYRSYISSGTSMSSNSNNKSYGYSIRLVKTLT